LSFDAERTQPSDENALKALESFRKILLVLVERPASTPLPSDGAKLGTEELAKFHRVVGRYAGLLPVLELPSNAAYAETAWLGALALQAGRVDVAESIYEEVNFGTSNVTALVYVMEGVLRFFGALIVIVLICLLILAIAFSWEASTRAMHGGDISPLFTTDFFRSELTKVAIGAFFGCWGGVASLPLQLPEFESLKGKSRAFLRATGTAQPIMGGIFAFVLGAVLSAKLINISVGGASDLSTWIFVVLGFLAGFSERFSRNLLNVVEGTLGGARGPAP
jgi:hypothetical protein